MFSTMIVAGMILNVSSCNVSDAMRNDLCRRLETGTVPGSTWALTGMVKKRTVINTGIRYKLLNNSQFN